MALVFILHGTYLQKYRNKISEAKEAVIEDMGDEWKLSFKLIVLHSVELRRVKLSSTVVLEVDQTIYMFVTLGVLV